MLCVMSGLPGVGKSHLADAVGREIGAVVVSVDPGIDGFPETAWEDVVDRRDEWQPWREDRLVIDSLDDHAATVARAVGYVTA